jgi:hypothetical protein
MSSDLRIAYHQVAHRRERALRSLLNLLRYFRSCSKGKEGIVERARGH